MEITRYFHHTSQAVKSDECDEYLKRDGGVLWIDLTGMDETEIEFLRQQFSFHPLTIEDIYHQGQRSKAEEFAHYLFIILKPVSQSGNQILFGELNIVVGSNYVVTIHPPDDEVITEAKNRIDPARVPFELSVSYLVYVLFDTILDHYLPILEGIENQLEDLSREALHNPTPIVLNRISDLKSDINQFWWAVWPQQDIIHILTSHDTLFTDQKSLYYLRDISDHLTRIMNSLQVSRDIATGLINIYMSSVSNKLNIAVSRLTLLTIAVGVLAVFSGFYGMNFEQTWPPFDAPWGVPAVIAMMILTLGGSFALMRRKRWI